MARVPSLRDQSGGIAYGLLRCTSSRCMRLRRTVAALPPPDQSLHSACRRALRSKAVLELTLIVVSGEGRVFGFCFVVGLPLTPALSPRRGSRFLCFSKPEFNAVSHVGEPLPNHSVSPFSLRERARVRGGGLDLASALALALALAFDLQPLRQAERRCPSGGRRAAPCGEAAYIERRCSEANRRRCPLMDTVAREH